MDRGGQGQRNGVGTQTTWWTEVGAMEGDVVGFAESVAGAGLH